MGPPFKCPDCGTWWAGPEHRCCLPTRTSTTGTIGNGLRCTCYIKGTDTVKITCPVHDTQVTFTY